MPDPTPYTQDELLLRIADGDERAFAELVKHYSGNVFSHCLAYVKSVHKAEELTQDIFVQIWNIRDNLKEIDRFNDYLFVLSRNYIFRSFRKKVTDLVALPDDLIQENTSLPNLQAEFKDAYHLVLKGIELLPEKRKRVFKLSRLEYKTHEEIAAITGIHKITVAQYIMLSLNFLKKYLEKQTGDTFLLGLTALGTGYIFFHATT